MLGATLVLGVVTLAGCGTGTYKIPNVAPVVKPKPGDDLLESIENGDSTPDTTASSSPSAPSSPPPASSDSTDSSSSSSTDSSDKPEHSGKHHGK
jgi:hypothetical protein